MTASSIAQYLEQRKAAKPAERGDPRKDAWAALAGRASAQSEGEPQAFRPLQFKSAPSQARASAESPATNPEPQASRSASPLFRPRETPPPQPDIEQKLSEAYHRGVQEGLDAARSEAATARALERAEIQKRLVVERLDFQMNEYAKFADQVAQGLKEIERRIAESVERILRPFLHGAITLRAVEEVAASVARLSSAGHPPVLKIRGPEPLLKLLKEKIGGLAVEVEFAPDAHMEITVEAAHTTIATELGAWADWLDSIDRSAES